MLAWTTNARYNEKVVFFLKMLSTTFSVEIHDFKWNIEKYFGNFSSN